MNVKGLYFFFLFSIFLTRFPPLYFFGVKNAIFTTEALSVVLLILIFPLLVWGIHKYGKNRMDMEDYLIVIFVFFQSISVVGIVNSEIFLQRYSKIIIGLLIYLVVSYLKKSRNKFRYDLMKTLVIGFIPVIILQLVLLVFPNYYVSFGKLFIYDNVYQTTLVNLARGKLFDDTYSIIIVPILLFFLFRRTQLVVKIILLCLFLSFAVVAFASNFRTFFITFIATSFLTILFLRGVGKRGWIILLLIAFFTVSAIPINNALISDNGFTVIDRLLLQDNSRDYSTIDWRFRMFQESIDMSLSRPFGVGLGNFYDFLPQNYKLLSPNKESSQAQIAIDALQSGPHNIFFQYLAETGFTGLISFIALLTYFVKKDIGILKGKNNEKKTLIMSFWALVLTVQAFPAINLAFYSLFFLLRAAI